MNAILLGYSFSIILGSVVIYFVMYFVFDKLDENQRNTLPYAGLIGAFERFIYTSSVLIDQYGLITGWLVLKAIGDWSSSPRSKARSWGAYTAYLIGNALSIVFGVIGGKLVCGFAEKCQPLIINLLK